LVGIDMICKRIQSCPLCSHTVPSCAVDVSGYYDSAEIETVGSILTGAGCQNCTCSSLLSFQWICWYYILGGYVIFLEASSLYLTRHIQLKPIDGTVVVGQMTHLQISLSKYTGRHFCRTTQSHESS